MIQKVMLFAGTTEGRLLCEFLSEKNITACVCVTTSYGEQLLPSGENMEICTGALDRAQMEEKLSSFRPQLVIDATHPYARLATENIRAACGFLNLPYIRVVRESCGKEKNGAETATAAEKTAGPEKTAEPEKTTGLTTTAGLTDITQKIGGQEESRMLTEADSMEEAAKLLEKMEGSILVTTGSKELEALRGLPGFAKRIFARILPQPEMVQKCMEMGLSGRHIICMQGPFSEEMNYAMLRETNARILLTKESGAAGGFPEKLRGARRAGAAVVVVKRPVEEEGCSVEEVKALLQNGGGNTVPCLRQNISILGIGMGSADSMTEGVKKLLSRAGLVAGAGRMLDACGLTEGTENRRRVLCAWEPDIICRAIEESGEAQTAVLMSGDSGFYSGTKKLLQALEAYREQMKGRREVTIHVEPGISSLSYFASRLQISWEDAKILSCHGKEENLLAAVAGHRKTFVLTEGQTGEICAELTAGGLGDTLVYEGTNLSGPGETIRKYPAREYRREGKDGLTVLFLINDRYGRFPVTGIPEESFLRGRVPMTKSEVRSVILSKLSVKEEDIVYDCGAGTGSVSVELALAAGKGRVYAVECDPEGIELIRRNGEKFGCRNLTAVEGMAPQVLEGLPAPDAVFIGGTKGRLSGILEALRQKKKPMRICLSAVTLETVSEALGCVESFRLQNAGACQIAVTGLQPIGGLHMLKAQNPIFLIWGDLTE
ncbi:MAG: precorrin-6Y C5,15-methyltransferase (decarboxylating) subunit CbiT [Eisenbergiella porci]|uniref:Precorrin-6Y C5,15-methyltransferase (Decarboxylating) subunit CbiT n=1 Tax=Eisenbergiella porci TaxID=2652274 RepID=A0A6N7WBU7_9FIRM|nr:MULTISPECIES: precorrin-6Y C5,15-methyltransferase (decarboxylating) subunit CbiT [Eisenbergiella]MDY2652010.1 precorrin-6Y C5,15-methyltransferase (decarboxylating) subunit CbiT [Eisenbergiella porci]MSS86948.1 precorrin-6Y C5,15-methyltransferase (decarboxylating) subunit CbiT [Eisenbergiella porci]